MDTIVYAARLKDKKQLMKSSSGGAFTAISNFFLQNGNAVVCTSYNYDNNEAVFNIITSLDQRDKALGSKYVQSNPKDVFNDALKWLHDHPHRELLFVGTGCQADAFRKYSEIVGIRDRVTVVDLICHGVPSPKLWKEYIDSFGPITYITFKDKRYGWLQPTAVIKTEIEEISLSEYVKVFYNHCALRPCCYECPYTAVVRQSDITIGDYWGIETAIPNFFSEDGTSLILIHTANGINIWDQIRDSLVYKKSNVKECLQPNLIHPTEKSKYRKLFWKDYYRHGALYVVKKYGNPDYELGLKKKVKKIIFNIRKKISHLCSASR